MIGPAYQELILKALSAPALAYQGVRKIIQPLDWDTAELPEVEFVDLGYGRNKLTQLKRNYWNDEEIARVKEVLSRRQKKSFTSVAVSLRNKSKDSRSMGHCMLSLVVSRTKGWEAVEVQYRSTELGLKFSGDLVFLPMLLDHLEVNPDVYRFRFANCFISGVYFPYIAAHWSLGAASFLATVFHLDEKLFKQSTRFFLRSAYKENQVFPYSPENVAHKFNWARNRAQMKEIVGFLEEKHKRYDAPLPKTHHKAGEYVPRGKRNQEEED